MSTNESIKTLEEFVRSHKECVVCEGPKRKNNIMCWRCRQEYPFTNKQILGAWEEEIYLPHEVEVWVVLQEMVEDGEIIKVNEDGSPIEKKT